MNLTIFACLTIISLCSPICLQNTAGREPDIMEMFSWDFEKETASYGIEGLPALKNTPTTVDLARAFDVYKHIRSWEGS